MNSPRLTLHIVNKPPAHARFAACLAAMGDDDTLLLTENGVLALTDGSLSLPSSTRALVADCQARGVTHGAQGIDYAGMVELTDRFPRIISW